MAKVEIDKDTGHYNPYLAAKLAWDERYGSILKREAAWRWTAGLAVLAALAIGAVANTLAVSAQHVRPFVAVVNGEDGRLIAQASQATTERDEWARQNALRSWVEDWRLVTTDAGLRKKTALRVVAMMGRNTQAYNYVVDGWKANPPDERAANGTVSADVSSILKIGDRTYEVAWIETEHSAQGDTAKQHYKASLTIAVNPPATQEEAQENPLGLFVTHAESTKVREDEK
jgi:type IV secretory pathway TrbF-like protein